MSKKKVYFKFSKEQQQFILDNYKGTTNADMLLKLEREFGIVVPNNVLENFKDYRGLKSGVNPRFTGKKRKNEPRSRADGSISFTNRYNRIKVNGKWVLYHHYLWEQAYGKIPKGCVVMFLDGNKQNVQLDNLALTSRNRVAVMNKLGLITDKPELTKTGLLIAELVNNSTEFAVNKKLNRSVQRKE